MSSKIKKERKLLAESYEAVMGTALALVGGFIFHTPYLIILGGVSAFVMLYECISVFIPQKSRKLDLAFEMCGLSNKNGELPKLLKESKNERGRAYCLTIPLGLKLKDFKDKSRELNGYFNSPVEVKEGSEENTVVIQTLDTYTSKKTLESEDVFRICGLKNADGIIPRIVEEQESSDGKRLIVTIPMGLKLLDFDGKLKELQHAFNSELEILPGPSQSHACIQFAESIESKNRVRFNNMFRTCGLVSKDGQLPVKLKATVNNLGEQYEFSIPLGMKLSDFEAKQTELKTAFGYDIDILEADTGNKVLIQLIQNELAMYPVTLNDDVFIHMQKDNLYIKDRPEDELLEELLGELAFPIGVKQTANGYEVAIVDFDKCERHILISGGTGAGKSTVLRLLFAMAIQKGMAIHAIDGKGTEAGIFKHYPDMIISTFKGDVVSHLTLLHQIMEYRFRIMYMADVENYREYNKSDKKIENRNYVPLYNDATGDLLNENEKYLEMLPLIIIFDEFSPYRKDKDCKEMLSQLLSIARAAGMYIVMSTQRIDSDTMGDMKVNLGIRLSMRTETEADSGIAMGGRDPRAYYLKQPGRLYMKYDGENDTMVQSFFLSSEQCKKDLDSKLIGKCINTMFVKDYDIDVMTGKPLKRGESQSVDLTQFDVDEVEERVDELMDKIAHIQKAIDVGRDKLDSDLMSRVNNKQNVVDTPTTSVFERGLDGVQMTDSMHDSSTID